MGIAKIVGSSLVSEDEIYHPMIFWLLGIVTRDQIFVLFVCLFSVVSAFVWELIFIPFLLFFIYYALLLTKFVP